MPTDRNDGIWVDEMDGPERHERAKKRRSEQLKRWEIRETTSNNEHANKKFKRSLNFEPNIVMLEAAARNDLDEVASLLESGVSPDLANEDGLTALHQSCIDGCDDMLKYLIKHKANINACDNELWTPLHAAAACGHISIIQYLLKNGADIMALNLDGNLPADVVEENDEVVNFLDKEMLKLGYDEAAIEEMRISQSKQLLDDLKDSVEKGRSLDIQDEDGATAFHVAAANGWTNVIDFLLENEADFEIADNDGWQAIHAAAAWGHETILEILVASGADLDSKTKDSRTPLDLTEESEIIDLIEELKTKEVKYPRKGKGVRRKRSNTSNSSIKRTSIHEKSELSHADTKAEGAALFMQLQNNENTEITSPVQVKPSFDIKQDCNIREESNSSGYVSEASSDNKTEEKHEAIQSNEVKLDEKKEGTDQNINEKDNLKVEETKQSSMKQSPVPKPPRRGTNTTARLDPQAYINYEIEPIEKTCKTTNKPDIEQNKPRIQNDNSQKNEPSSENLKPLNNELKTEEHGSTVQGTDHLERRTTSTLPKLAPTDKRKAPEPPNVATESPHASVSEKGSKKASRSRARSSRSSENSSKKRCTIL